MKTLIHKILWLARASKGVRLGVLLTIALGVSQIALGLLFIWLTKDILDIATSGGDNITRSLIVPTISLCVTVVAQLIIYALRIYIDGYNVAKLRRRLKDLLFKELLYSEWKGVEVRHSGDLISRLEIDLQSVCTTITAVIPILVITFVQLIGSFIFFHSMAPKLAWILVAIMPITLIISKYFFRTLRSLTHSIRGLESENTAYVQEHLQRRVIINSLCGGEAIVNSFVALNERLFGANMKLTRYMLFSKSVLQFGFSAGYVVAFVWGVVGLVGGSVTYGMLNAFLQLVWQIQRPVVDIGTQVSTLVNTTVAVDRLAELSSLLEEDAAVEVEYQRVEGAIGVKLHNLNFSYADGGDREVLVDLNYDFAPSKLHLVVGETGAGKSTLIHLMLGLLRPTQGEIGLYVGENFYPSSQSMRANFVYVPQGNTLTSGTVRSNLLLANPNATDDDIRRALHIAVADFVYELPDGVECQIGEQGEGVSEGEAQRIAIARALLREGGVLLLDEPTSALDANTESLLLTRLEEHAAGRTIIMVTHREISAERCGSILKLRHY